MMYNLNTHDVFMHELKNPLGVIYSLCQLLENTDNINEVKSIAPLITTAVEQVTNIEKQYTQYKKIGKISIKKTAIDLDKFFKGTIDKYVKIHTNTSITYIASNLSIKTDSAKLQQIIDNLLENSIKYSRVLPIIFIDCAKKSYNKIEISITDNGIGMSPDEIKKLGTPFYRCKRVDVNGTGLVLPIIYSIVKQLQWRISIKSTVNTGTTVTLII